VARYGPGTALVVVDVQNDFADPGGSLYVTGGETVARGVSDEVRAARDAGAFVAYTQDWHPPETPHFTTGGGTWPPHCVRETWGAELHPDLLVDGPVVRKGTGGEDGYSGFSVRDPVSGEESATELGTLLHERGTEHVVVVGLAQDVCVKETALDAQRLGFSVEVPLSLTRPVELSAGDGGRSVEAMRAAGVEVV
jgi:nicotinamidase/pyrazinamidase